MNGDNGRGEDGGYDGQPILIVVMKVHVEVIESKREEAGGGGDVGVISKITTKIIQKRRGCCCSQRRRRGKRGGGCFNILYYDHKIE